MPPNEHAKLFPQGLSKYIDQNVAQELTCVVTAESGHVEQFADELVQAGLLPDIADAALPIIHGFEVRGEGRDFIRLARSENVQSVWFIHPRMRGPYMSIIRGLDHFVTGEPVSRIINLSLAPPPDLLPIPFRPAEPLHRATRHAAARGALCIFAAGNGGPGPGSINPWSIAPWVVSVGACSEDGKQLLPSSGRGVPTDTLSRPTVIAPGIYHLPYWEDDDGSVHFSKSPPDGRESGSLPQTGTSYAAPEVAVAAMQIEIFLERFEKYLIEQKGAPPDRAEDFYFANIFVGRGQKPRDPRLTTDRVVGTLDVSDGSAIGRYPLRRDPLVIKQILMDMAMDMPSCEPYEIGAGVVSAGLAKQCFSTFGTVEDISVARWCISQGLLTDKDG